MAIWILLVMIFLSVLNLFFNYNFVVYMGGTAGLCVGASLLTGVEFIYYLLIRPFNDRTRRIRLTKNRQFIKRNMKPPYKFLN